MAITMYEEKINEYTNVYIFMDNQSTIQTVEAPTQQSGQHIITEILDIIDRIHEVKPECNIHIEWIPGHKDVEGNEKADQAAKAAAVSDTTRPTARMKAAQSSSIQSMAKANWETEWKSGKENSRRLRKMSQYPGTNTGHKLYGTLEQREHVVWITRLRTGHCHLNGYLHRFNIIETPDCEYGAEKETVDHYLLNCELYDEERDALRRKVGSHAMRTSVLLGDNKVIKETLKYIENTGCFRLQQG